MLITISGFIVIQNSNRPVSITITKTAAINYEACAYTQAYHSAPELTNKINAMVTKVNPKAKAHASLYGEDCVYADGRADFSAKETDFYVSLPVGTLANKTFFGDWAAQIMPLIMQISHDEIQSDYGFVEFRFEKSKTEQTILRIPIQKYIDNAQKKSGIDLYEMFSTAP